MFFFLFDMSYEILGLHAKITRLRLKFLNIFITEKINQAEFNDAKLCHVRAIGRAK